MAKVAETGSITAAAGHLGCVQSNVTNRLKQIEALLGVTLFTRAGGRMVASAAAQALAQAAPRADAILSEAVAYAKASGSGQRVLRVGMMETFAVTHLTGLLQLLSDVTVLPATGPSAEIAERVRLGTLEFGIISQAIRTPDLDVQELWTDRFVLARSRRPGEPGIVPDLERIAVIRGIDALLRAQLLEIVTEITGHTPDVLEVGSLDVIRSVVAGGIACTILPERYFVTSPFTGTDVVITEIAAKRLAVRISAIRRFNQNTDDLWDRMVGGLKAAGERRAASPSRESTPRKSSRPAAR